VAALLYHPARAARDTMSTTYLVEGHVALEVPARWPVRRIVAGPGSARLQVSSPADPEVALHVTQSRVALTGLAATAEFLRGAIDAAPAGVFVDFNPADRSAGRPVVTYREVRADHDVRWTVWVDKAIRISIGCQSRHGDAEAVSQECDLVVRSARALM
jgi:type VII secretion-associated protein (TIGR03931 family)